MAEVTVDVDITDYINEIRTKDLIDELQTRKDIPDDLFEESEDRFTDLELDTLLGIFRLAKNRQLITRSEHLDLYDKLLQT